MLKRKHAFLGRKTEAPLKLLESVEQFGGLNRLPRSKDRGPIEARRFEVDREVGPVPSSVERPRPH